MKKMLPFLIVVLLDFYLLPFLIKDTGSGMVILLFIIPVICLICSLIYGIKNTFKPIFPFVVTILFIPTIFIFFNSSAWIYIPINGLISFIGVYIGAQIQHE